VNQVILAVQGIVLVPFFLKAWGVDEYGHWLTLTAFVSYLTLLDLGGQNYFANVLAISFAKKDTDEFFHRLSEGVSLFLFLGIFGFGAWTAIIWYGSNWSFPGLERTLLYDEAWILIFMGAFFLLVSNVGGVYSTIYRATGLFARGAMIGNGMRILSIVISMCLLYFSIEPKNFAAFQFIFGGLWCSVFLWDSRRKIEGSHKVKINITNAKTGLKHLKSSFYFWILAFSQAIKQHGTLIILASFTNPLTVSTFATHRVLSNFAGYIRVLLQGPVLPELSFLWGQDRVKELYEFILISLKWVVVLTGTASILIWFAGSLFYPVWTGNELESHPYLFFLLLVQGVLVSGSQTASWGLLATNHHRSMAQWSFASSFLTLGLAYYLAPRYGVTGIVWAGVFSELSIGVLVFPALCGRFFKTSSLPIYRAFINGLLILCPFMGLAYLIDGLFSKLSSTLILVFLGLIVAFMFKGNPELKKLKI